MKQQRKQYYKEVDNIMFQVSEIWFEDIDTGKMYCGERQNTPVKNTTKSEIIETLLQQIETITKKFDKQKKDIINDIKKNISDLQDEKI